MTGKDSACKPVQNNFNFDRRRATQLWVAININAHRNLLKINFSLSPISAPIPRLLFSHILTDASTAHLPWCACESGACLCACAILCGRSVRMCLTFTYCFQQICFLLFMFTFPRIRAFVWVWLCLLEGSVTEIHFTAMVTGYGKMLLFGFLCVG